MKLSEIERLTEKNDRDQLHSYLTITIDKSKSLEKEVKQLTITMLLLIVLHYFIDTSTGTGLTIMGIEIKDLEVAKTFMPLIFAFILLKYIILTFHKMDLGRIIKIVACKYFDYKTAEDEDVYDFIRCLVPVSIYTEVNKFFILKGGCVAMLFITILTLSVFIFPLVIELIWLWDLVLEFECLDFYGKCSVGLTICLILIMITILFKNIYYLMKDQSKKKEGVLNN